VLFRSLVAINLAADIAANAALLVPVSNVTVPHSDYKQWQLHWNSETQNKLHVIEPRMNVINLICFPCGDEIIIDRLRIGRPYLTHGHLLRVGDPFRCLAYQVELTVSIS